MNESCTNAPAKPQANSIGRCRSRFLGLHQSRERSLMGMTLPLCNFNHRIMALSKITTCLWFDGKAEEAVAFYTSIFKESKITNTSYYKEAGKEYHGKDAGTVMTVSFELNGHPFVALNGGPMFKFTEATSFIIDCKDQEEVDYYWDKLSAGGDEKKQNCGK
jgi:predicted 3-demethylubiquinone-9 3-methyltransferase (glyoxalase superfamily)